MSKKLWNLWYSVVFSSIKFDLFLAQNCFKLVKYCILSFPWLCIFQPVHQFYVILSSYICGFENIVVFSPMMYVYSSQYIPLSLYSEGYLHLLIHIYIYIYILYMYLINTAVILLTHMQLWFCYQRVCKHFPIWYSFRIYDDHNFAVYCE